jgi:hypothetical protein
VGTVATFLAERVAAAWTLGEPRLLEGDLSWLIGWLERQGLSLEAVRSLLAVSRLVVATVGAELGQPHEIGLYEPSRRA